MAKTPLASLKTFLRNLARNIGWLWAKRVTWTAFRVKTGRDMDKLRHAFRNNRALSDEWVRQAKEQVEEGRRHFNAHHYEKAEQAFREAIASDPHNAWANAYLGHTLYHLARVEEAMLYWRRAMEADPGSKAAAIAQAKLDLVKNKQRRAADDFFDYVARH